MMQAAVLNRALFETLATVLALTEDPDTRAVTLLREAIKMHAATYKRQLARFGNDPTWKGYLDVFRTRLTVSLGDFGLPLDVLNDPVIITDEWPTPGAMLWGNKRAKTPPFVSGSRHDVLKEFYEEHYPFQSAQAHARVAAMSMASLVDQPEQQWNPGHGESNIVVTALLFLACILSKIEAAGHYAHHAKLFELWSFLRDLDGEAKDLWALRYEEIMKSQGGSEA
jgi:hypothetical protein